jgi:hypothetical protein
MNETLATVLQATRQIGVRRMAACVLWYSAEGVAYRAADVLDNSAHRLNDFAHYAYTRGKALDIYEDEIQEEAP